MIFDLGLCDVYLQKFGDIEIMQFFFVFVGGEMFYEVGYCDRID